MSALDQAFIKAFAKEPRAAQPRVTSRSGTAAPGHRSEPAVFDELYDMGTFYRVDTAVDQAVPAAHAPVESKLPRRLQRRANRAEPEAEEIVVSQPAPEQNAHRLPPRRQWSQSMLEIARRLARLDQQHALAGELPPEIVYIEPLVPAAPPEPSAPAEQNVLPDIEAEECPPLALANLWPIDAVITQSSIVNSADAETWLAAPVAPAVVCNENIANGWAASEIAEVEAAAPVPTAPQNIEAAFKATVIPESPTEDTKTKKKFRIDGSHSRITGPHTKPAVAEQPIVETAVVEEPKPAGDLQAVVSPPLDSPVAESPAPTVSKRLYVPLWEVDRFTWPPLCDKLMHDPQGYFASASNKLLSVVRGGLKVLGITGSRRGEGRTTLALCLARAAAQAGIHVALVDADFARPQIAQALGLETAYGWQEAATGKIPLSEAAVKSLADRLTVLPLEVSTSTARLSLADPRVTATLRATAATFELVIVDLGPLGSSHEALFPPGENCPLDAAVVVRDVRYTLVNESRAAGDRLYEAGIEAVGIAENFVTQPELAFL